MQYRAAVAGVTLLFLAGAAGAGPLDGLKGVMGGAPQAESATGGAGGAGILGTLASGSFEPLSLHNVAGVLSFCEKQGFSGSATDVAKKQLMARLGGAPERNEGYQDGLGGVLKGRDGTDFSLAGLKKQAGEKVCGMLAKQALSSVLGL